MMSLGGWEEKVGKKDYQHLCETEEQGKDE